jgi:hypothetical protein
MGNVLRAFRIAAQWVSALASIHCAAILPL